MGERRLPAWIRWILAIVLLAGSWLGLARLDLHSEAATVDALIRAAKADIETAVKESHLAREGKYPAVLVLEGDAAAHRQRIIRHLEASSMWELGSRGHRLVVEIDLSGERPSAGMRYAMSTEKPVIAAAGRARVSGSALFPAILAIVLAFATGRVVPSLGIAVVLGALLSTGFSPLEFAPHAAKDYFWKATFTDPFKLWIIAFTCGLLGMVRLATRAGGVQGIVDRIAGRVRGARSAQRATVMMGACVFFDDYANTVLVGSTMRPLSDRLMVAREKLAYLVDSTAAPIAGVALVSTWIGFEIGLLSDAASGVGMESEGYGLFLQALPFRFYCFFTLFFVALLVLTGRDFGPMLRAERRAADEGLLLRPDASPLAEGDLDENTTLLPHDAPRLAHVALLPISLVLGGTVLGLFWDGGGFSGGIGGLVSPLAWREAFGDAENGTFVMAMATLCGSALLFALVLGHRLLSPGRALRAYLEGIWSMALAVVILVLAWAMKAVCDDLGADHLLVAVLGDSLSPFLVPLAVFLLAAIVAFATGTSWGTMAILIPVAVPLSFELGGAGLTIVTMAAVLDGAIFGDHCSPISDTTVMTSIATHCDHMDHVRTQVPYALTTMTVAAIFGYVWIGAELPWAGGMLLGAVVLVAIVWVVGRDARRGKSATRGADSPPPGESQEAA